MDIIEAANTLWDIYYINKTCQICRTEETCQWRKNDIYNCLCNKCGVRMFRATKKLYM